MRLEPNLQTNKLRTLPLKELHNPGDSYSTKMPIPRRRSKIVLWLYLWTATGWWSLVYSLLLVEGFSTAPLRVGLVGGRSASLFLPRTFLQKPLSAKRKPMDERGRSEKYYDYYEDEDDGYFQEPSLEEQELREMAGRFEANRDDDDSTASRQKSGDFSNDIAYEDESEVGDSPSLSRAVPRASDSDQQEMSRYRRRDKNEMNLYYEDDGEDYVYNDEYDDDDDADEEDLESTGNFWSNPGGSSLAKPSRTPPPPRRRRRKSSQRNLEQASYYDDRRSRRPRRSSLGYGAPPPRAAKDFYERLFWYGFDPDDTEEVGDKTVFGGTKGKFNGLSFLQESEKPQRPPRRELPPSKRSRDSYYEDDDDFDYEYDESYGDDGTFESGQTNGFAARDLKPPNDRPIPKREKLSPRQQRPRSRSRRSEYYDEEDEYLDSDDDYGYGQQRGQGGDWVSRRVASWFGDDEEDYDNGDQEFYGSDGTRGRRQRRKDRAVSKEWSPFNILDTFLGVDRDDMQYKAELYDSQMGLRSSSSRRRREGRPQRRSLSTERQSRKTPRRPGYAYKYDKDDEERHAEDSDDFLVVDIDASDENGAGSSTDNTVTQTMRNGSSGDVQEGENRRQQLSWEDRALAVERVPPAGIKAWGPSGELPMDARTKAIMDALEDLQVARQKLEAKRKKEQLAKEEITILKVDAELERRKLEGTSSSSRQRLMAEERLRESELDLDEASRVLRRARTQVRLATDELEDLKERHWAVLGCYNPDQAGEQVTEALMEFQQLEPAARLENFGDTSTKKPEPRPETVSSSPAATLTSTSSDTQMPETLQPESPPE